MLSDPSTGMPVTTESRCSPSSSLDRAAEQPATYVGHGPARRRPWHGRSLFGYEALARIAEICGMWPIHPDALIARLAPSKAMAPRIWFAHSRICITTMSAPPWSARHIGLTRTPASSAIRLASSSRISP